MIRSPVYSVDHGIIAGISVLWTQELRIGEACCFAYHGFINKHRYILSKLDDVNFVILNYEFYKDLNCNWVTMLH